MNEYSNGAPKTPRRTNALATAALSLSIIGFFTILLGGPIILGSTAIVLALLSRGSGRLEKKAGAAIILSILSMLAGIAVVIALVIFILTSAQGQSMLEDYMSYYMDQYLEEYGDELQRDYDLSDEEFDDLMEDFRQWDIPWTQPEISRPDTGGQIL